MTIILAQVIYLRYEPRIELMIDFEVEKISIECNKLHTNTNTLNFGRYQLAAPVNRSV